MAIETMTDAIIRRATPADIDALAAIGAETFAAAFGHLYPAADLRAFLANTHAPGRIGRDLADPAHAAWLLEEAGRAIGYADVGPCTLPHPDVTPACGELKRLYVLAARQGGGAGSRLLAAALAWLERAGPRRLWIGVWSGNLGAQKLYAAMGFKKVGEYDFAVGAQRDHEFIFRRG